MGGWGRPFKPEGFREAAHQVFGRSSDQKRFGKSMKRSSKPVPILSLRTPSAQAGFALTPMDGVIAYAN
jgi:hypothetical protein